VRISNASATFTFCLAAAVTAAAAADPAIERMSDTGLFGPGTFTDHSNLDVLPALAAGLILAALVVAGLVRRTLTRRGAAPAWLRRCARAGSGTSLRTLVPIVFTLQLIVLWSMETLEQIAVAGHPLGGTVWLGGPPAISLSLHGVACAAFTLLLARMLRWSAETIADVVTFIRAFFCARSTARPARRARAGGIAPAAFLAPLLARLHGRAPPFLTA
jgi:hypothetical protein